MTSPRDAPEAGRRIGSYILYDTIARGGAAEVRFGRRLATGGFAKVVAIKQLRAEHARDPDFVAMLVDEARLASRIRHPNVVSVLDVVESGGELLVVMEYVEGESLGRLLWSPAPGSARPTVEVVAAIVRDVLHGLDAAHEALDERGRSLGIVHRDVSPANVLVGRDGAARIADFGVAKAAGRLQQTREGSVKGKVAYMAPEHARGGELTRRSDVYACGIMLWEALVGERLFTGLSEAQLFLRVLNETVPPPSSRAPHLSAAVDRVVLDAVARDPEERYESARDFADALSEVIDLASPSQVGAWVESAAGPSLAARDATLAALERPRLVSSASTPAFSPTYRLVGAGLGGVILVCLVAARVTMSGPAVPGPSTSAPSLLPPAAASATDAGASLAVAQELDDSPDAATPAGPPRPRRRLAPGGTAGTKDCDPPYDVDSAGHRHYRAECVRGR